MVHESVRVNITRPYPRIWEFLTDQYGNEYIWFRYDYDYDELEL